MSIVNHVTSHRDISSSSSSFNSHSVSEINSINSSPQRNHQFASNVIWTVVSFGAGVVLTVTWNRIYRSSWKNYSPQERNSNNPARPHQQIDSDQQNDDNIDNHDRTSIQHETSAGMKTTINNTNTDNTISSPPKWPWDRLKKFRQTAETPTTTDDDVNNSTTTSNSNEKLWRNEESDDERRQDVVDDQRKNGEHHHHQQPPPPPSQCCIGSIFGMDVGGTLAKLCYFESHIHRHENIDESNNRSGTKVEDRSTSSGTITGSAITKYIRRRHSMNGRIQYNSHNYSLRRGSTGHDSLNHHHHSTTTNTATTSSSSSSGSHAVKRRSWVDPHHFYLHPHSDDGIMVDGTNIDTISALHRTNGIPPLSTQIHLRRVQSLMNVATIRSVSLPVPKTNHIYGSDTTTTCSDDHTMALHRFYDFARRLDTYRAGTRDPNLSFYSKELDGSFHFIKFETRRMIEAMDLIRTHKLHDNIHEMGGTGGGAHKFAAIWQQQLGIRMKKQDELDSLVAGMQFVLSTVIGECYTFRPDQDDRAMKHKHTSDSDNQYGDYFGIDDESDRTLNPNNTDSQHPTQNDETNDAAATEKQTIGNDTNIGKEFRPQGDEWWWSRKVQRDSISSSDSSTYPYLVVTIGTGVSILRVDGPRQYERVSGSTIGGGTYLGLIRLLTDVEDFDDVMRLAERGDPSKVDMMVGDIYGENSDALEKLGLPSNLVASSFGKLVTKDDPAVGLKQEDLARALLLMITNNIGQVAYLNAKIFQTPRIYFVGNFLRHNNISQRRLSYAINYWSKGEMEALFLEHEGYFGAMGAFLLAQDISVSDITRRNTVTNSMTSTGTGTKSEHSLHRRSATISNF